MKTVIASDIHGSEKYCKSLLDAFEKSNADQLILLGDIFYHGPRNPIPEGYAPMEVNCLLEKICDKLIVLKGNCDSEVDAMIAPFTFSENCVLLSGGKKIFLSHGHVFNKDNMPKGNFHAVIYGHFHVGFIEKSNGTVIANPGSISLPKGGTDRSYLVIEENVMSLLSLDGKLIKKTEIK